jgi:hypothetical protein
VRDGVGFAGESRVFKVVEGIYGGVQRAPGPLLNLLK